MLALSPYITFKGNCRDAIQFYKNALNAEVLMTQTFGESPMAGMGPADNIMHCSLKIGNSTLMMSDSPSQEPGGAAGNISLAIGLTDAEQAKQLFGNLAKDGSVIMPLEKTYWAEAFGMLTDKFGIKWMINCEAPR